MNDQNQETPIVSTGTYTAVWLALLALWPPPSPLRKLQLLAQLQRPGFPADCD